MGVPIQLRSAGSRGFPCKAPSFFGLLLILLLSGPAGGEIATGSLAPGTKWETPYHLIEGSRPGPTVLVTGGLHGNEPAGSLAAEQILHWPILRGRLVVLPRANQPGLRKGTRHLPEVARQEADLNRNFPRRDGKNEASSLIGKEIWELAQKFKPDWLIDLHDA